jgi:hypothetical protein
VKREAFFRILGEFITKRSVIYENIKEQRMLWEYFVVGTVATVVFSAAYGAVMGVYAGGIQIAYDAVKIPMLLMISLYVSMPTFYVLNGILGGELNLRQLVTLFLVSMTVMGAMLIAFLPVTLFFILTTPERIFIAYAFNVLLTVIFFGIAGLTAVIYFLNGFVYIHGENRSWVPAMIIGSLVLAFVGTQLAWVLRPYFHQSLVFIAPPSGNFYLAVIELLMRLLLGY